MTILSLSLWKNMVLNIKTKSIMKNLITLLLIIFSTCLAYGKDYVVLSPDKKTEVTVYTNQALKISVRHHDNELFTVDKISFEIEGGLLS